MKWKVPSNIKWTFVFNCALLFTGVVVGDSAVVGASVVIFVVLSVGIEILEAIYKLK